MPGRWAAWWRTVITDWCCNACGGGAVFRGGPPRIAANLPSFDQISSCTHSRRSNHGKHRFCSRSWAVGARGDGCGRLLHLRWAVEHLIRLLIAAQDLERRAARLGRPRWPPCASGRRAAPAATLAACGTRAWHQRAGWGPPPEGRRRRRSPAHRPPRCFCHPTYSRHCDMGGQDLPQQGPGGAPGAGASAALQLAVLTRAVSGACAPTAHPPRDLHPDKPLPPQHYMPGAGHLSGQPGGREHRRGRHLCVRAGGHAAFHAPRGALLPLRLALPHGPSCRPQCITSCRHAAWRVPTQRSLVVPCVAMCFNSSCPALPSCPQADADPAALANSKVRRRPQCFFCTTRMPCPAASMLLLGAVMPAAVQRFGGWEMPAYSAAVCSATRTACPLSSLHRLTRAHTSASSPDPAAGLPGQAA